jgi:DMSO/TMAO reductase YedYZ heme-binding membrane subunit
VSHLFLQHLTRATGIVAVALIVLALGGGLLFSARATGDRRAPAWWLDLHNYLGGLAFAFTLGHVAAAYLDAQSGIGLRQVFIPMTATGWAWGITWGVIATYVFAAVVFTSWPRKRLSRRAWLAVHLLSVPATVMAAGHAWMVGSSRHGSWFKALLAVLVGLSVYPGVLRLARVLERRKAKRARAADASRRAPVGVG